MEEAIQTMMSLGLTIVQAKVYLALAKTNTLTIKNLSNSSGISRTNLYQITIELENKGLVERILTSPCKYKATPLNVVLDQLFQNRNKQTLEIQKKVKTLKQSFKENPNSLRNDKAKFVLFSGKRMITKIGENIDNTKESVNLIVSWKRFSQGLNFFSEKIKNSWSKKVKWRIITEVPPKNKHTDDTIEFYRQSPFCEIRFVPPPLSTIAGIYDQKTVVIIENPAANLSDSPALWTNNNSLLSETKDYFEILWITTMKEPQYHIDREILKNG